MCVSVQSIKPRDAPSVVLTMTSFIIVGARKGWSKANCNWFFSRRQASNKEKEPTNELLTLWVVRLSSAIYCQSSGPCFKASPASSQLLLHLHWSHNAGLTLCLLTQRACESQIQQDDFAAVWLTGKCSLIWRTFFFFSSKWTCLFLQHGVQALYLFDIGLCDIPAGQGRTQDIHNLPCKVTHNFSLSLSFSLPAD